MDLAAQAEAVVPRPALVFFLSQAIVGQLLASSSSFVPIHEARSVELVGSGLEVEDDITLAAVF